MEYKVGDRFWIITDPLYPEMPEECRICEVHDDGTYTYEVGNDWFTTEANELFDWYKSYDEALLMLVHGIYDAFRSGTDCRAGRKYIHICAEDTEDIIIDKYEKNVELVKSMFASVYDNVLPCYMTAYSCSGSLTAIIDTAGSNGLSRLKVRQALRPVIIIENYAVDPEIAFFPLTLKKYLWMLQKFNSDAKVAEVLDYHRTISWKR